MSKFLLYHILQNQNNGEEIDTTEKPDDLIPCANEFSISNLDKKYHEKVLRITLESIVPYCIKNCSTGIARMNYISDLNLVIEKKNGEKMRFLLTTNGVHYSPCENCTFEPQQKLQKGIKTLCKYSETDKNIKLTIKKKRLK